MQSSACCCDDWKCPKLPLVPIEFSTGYYSPLPTQAHIWDLLIYRSNIWQEADRYV